MSAPDELDGLTAAAPPAGGARPGWLDRRIVGMAWPHLRRYVATLSLQEMARMAATGDSLLKGLPAVIELPRLPAWARRAIRARIAGPRPDLYEALRLRVDALDPQKGELLALDGVREWYTASMDGLRLRIAAQLEAAGG